MDRNLEDECPICLDINSHNECILLECCNKYIHKDCIDHWLMQNINQNNINNNNCLYCYKTTKYIDDFINNNNNHQIININGQIIESENNILNENNYLYQKYCGLILLITLFLTFTIWATLSIFLN